MDPVHLVGYHPWVDVSASSTGCPLAFGVIHGILGDKSYSISDSNTYRFCSNAGHRTSLFLQRTLAYPDLLIPVSSLLAQEDHCVRKPRNPTQAKEETEMNANGEDYPLSLL
jgi:hypothetical protein